MLRTGRAVALGCRWMSSGSASSKPTSSLDGFMFPGPRALKHIAKLPLLEKEPVEKVDAIWREYHNAHKTAVSDVLSASQYNVRKTYPPPQKNDNSSQPTSACTIQQNI